MSRRLGGRNRGKGSRGGRASGPRCSSAFWAFASFWDGELTGSSRYFTLLARILLFIGWMGFVRVRTFAWKMARKAGWGGDEALLAERWRATGGPDADDEADEDWVPSSRVLRAGTPGSDSSDDSSSSSEEEASSEAEDDFNPTTLYSDLSSPARRRASPEPSTSTILAPFDPAESYGPVLLAHHLSTGSPLTRRRYQALASPGTQAFSSAVLERRKAVERKGWEGEKDEGRQRCCVVCQVEERSIICWPCRACRSFFLVLGGSS